MERPATPGCPKPALPACLHKQCVRCHPNPPGTFFVRCVPTAHHHGNHSHFAQRLRVHCPQVTKSKSTHKGLESQQRTDTAATLLVMSGNMEAAAAEQLAGLNGRRTGAPLDLLALLDSVPIELQRDILRNAHFTLRATSNPLRSIYESSLKVFCLRWQPGKH